MLCILLDALLLTEDVPETNRVVVGARDEGVARGIQRKGCNCVEVREHRMSATKRGEIKHPDVSVFIANNEERNSGMRHHSVYLHARAVVWRKEISKRH